MFPVKNSYIIIVFPVSADNRAQINDKKEVLQIKCGDAQVEEYEDSR